MKSKNILALLAALLMLPFSNGIAHSRLPKDVYLGFFGGTGETTSRSLSQQGTALYGANKGGPLEVNAKGKADMNTPEFVGLFLGRTWAKQSYNTAIELEGFYLKSRQSGEELDNNTLRLDEHDFKVSYPMNTGVFLANGVLSLDRLNFKTVHPYAGIGVGTAFISISGANATQTTPPELGINHYNSNPDASSWAFAAQPKIGLQFNFTPETKVFIEYRFLYLSPTHYTFGSTQYPTHIATTPWRVNMSAMTYSMGSVGVIFDAV